MYDFLIHFHFVELQENKLNQPVTEINQHNKMRPGVISDRNLAREHKVLYSYIRI